MSSADVWTCGGGSQQLNTARSRPCSRRRRCPAQRRPVTEKNVEHPLPDDGMDACATPGVLRVPRLIRVSRPPTYILPQRKSGDLPTLSHFFSASYTSSLLLLFTLSRLPPSSLGRPRSTFTVNTRTRAKRRESERNWG